MSDHLKMDDAELIARLCAEIKALCSEIEELRADNNGLRELNRQLQEQLAKLNTPAGRMRNALFGEGPSS